MSDRKHVCRTRPAGGGWVHFLFITPDRERIAVELMTQVLERPWSLKYNDAKHAYRTRPAGGGWVHFFFFIARGTDPRKALEPHVE